MPLCQSEDAYTSMSTLSALVELTPLEFGDHLLKDNVEGCLTQYLTSHVLLGWVDGILHPLPMVVHRTAHQDQGSTMKDMFRDDDDIY